MTSSPASTPARRRELLSKADRLVAEDSRLFVVVIPIETNKGAQMLKAKLEERMNIQSYAVLLTPELEKLLNSQP